MTADGHCLGTPDWVTALRRHLGAVAVGNFAWEFAHLPLYTLWRTGTPGEIAFAALHCTLGDVLIAACSLVAALLFLGAPEWPRRRFAPVAAAAVAIGLGYTVYSEAANLARGTWAYSELMPTLPWLGTGLSPLVQWLLIPTASLAWACRRRRRRMP
ncbi:hypothetical protein E2C06_12040 [Dankookia rubra]|uniref:Uncharacterized protein n=1 Tax=Dankookia rubra TaxID=1442381 RepID=A0A4R5QGB6_9PROT|nr:hypothetical protein [Dankookia rubra]TDH62334.1 hypothetical protein E2C06_12040 [Dankookia rubra]